MLINEILRVALGALRTNKLRSFLTLRKFELDAGRMFTAGEDHSRQRVAVIGPAILENLGLDNPAAILGEAVRIRGIEFTVIGILKSKGQGGGFFNPDDQVLIPLE